MSTIECLICGKKLKALSPHLKLHKITGEEYKKKFNVKTLVSDETSKRIGARPYGKPWSYGLTKETDPRLKIMGEKISRANKGRLIWNDGLSSDPNSPNYDPRMEQVVKTRKENDHNNLIAQRIVQTRRERYGSAMCRDPEARNKNISKALRNGGSKRAVETRRKNDPNNEAAKKAVRTRKERYPPSGFKDYDALCRRMKVINNDPEKIALSLKVMRERYGPTLMSDPEKFAREHSKFMTEWWASQTPERKRELMLNSILKGSQRPNKTEITLIPILEPPGFNFNKENPIFIMDHLPDFIHQTLPLVIEFDGFGGHHPNHVESSPFVPINQPELDDQRDKDYQTAGWYVLRLLPEDLKLGEEHTQNKVKNWMSECPVLLGDK